MKSIDPNPDPPATPSLHPQCREMFYCWELKISPVKNHREILLLQFRVAFTIIHLISFYLIDLILVFARIESFWTSWRDTLQILA